MIEGGQGLACVSGSRAALAEKPTTVAMSLKAVRHLSAAERLSMSFFCMGGFAQGRALSKAHAPRGRSHALA